MRKITKHIDTSLKIYSRCFVEIYVCNIVTFKFISCILSTEKCGIIE